jgi:hypothetical protein
MEARTIELEKYIASREGDQIPPPAKEPQRAVGASGSGIRVLTSSTPAPPREVKHVAYAPFINNNGGRHVDPGSVYRSDRDYSPSEIGEYEGYAGGEGHEPDNNLGPPINLNPGGSGAGTTQRRVANPIASQQNVGPPTYNRRSSMSVGMQNLHDANPCIAGLGIDCYSATVDGVDTMEWTMAQGNRLQGAANAARRVAKTPRPYNSSKPWREEYPNFLDDMEASGWNKAESLPHLVNWLKDGPGRSAVTQWRAEYGYHGSYDNLVATASYLFGNAVAEDPMTVFKKRTQKPKESYKIFGLELQGLLKLARPKWRFDDSYFLSELFLTFINGLRDPDHIRIATDAWGNETSLQDLFLSIENFDRKKPLLNSLKGAFKFYFKFKSMRFNLRRMKFVKDK